MLPPRLAEPASPTSLSLWRLQKLTFLALVIGMMGVSAFRSLAQDAASEKKADAKPKVEFSAEAEKKFSEFLTKASDGKRKLWAERMKKEIEEIAKTTKIDAAGVEALTSTADKAADLCREGWIKKVDQFWRRQYGRQPQEGLAQMIDEVTSQLDQYVKNDFFGDYVRPNEHPMWIEALKKNLSAEQSAAWEKAQAERKEAILKEIGDFLKPMLAEIRESFSRGRETQCTNIKQSLTLPKARADQLDELVKTIADQNSEAWRKQAERNLLMLDDNMRKTVMKNRGYYTQLEEEEGERFETMWKDGLAKLLSPEEMQRLDKSREGRKARWMHGYALLMIAEFDQRIALTASQRERIGPLIEKLVPSLNVYPSEEQSFYSNDINLASLLKGGMKVDEEELKAILDPLQMKHWKEVCADPEEDWRRRPVFRRNNQKAPEKEPAPILEPDEVEHVISDFYRDRTASQRKRTLLAMIVKAEDAARVATINPESLDRLGTAARGAAERSFAVWRENLEANIRSNLSGADGENVKRRLDSIPEYRLYGNYGTGNQTTILDDAIKAELNDEQKEAWKKEVDARKEYRAKAVAAYILAQFDRRHLLTVEQFEKIASKAEAILQEYEQEFAQMFSYYAGGWHLQYFSQFMPIAGIPEKELKGILSKEQWESWTGSNEWSNSNSYWENVKRNHEARTKEKKK